jgi:hypothetical protein
MTWPPKGPADIIPETPSYNLKNHLAYVRELWLKYPYREQEHCVELAVSMVPDNLAFIGEDVGAFIASLLEQNIYIYEPTLEYQPFLTRIQKRLTLNVKPALDAIPKFLQHLAAHLPSTSSSITVPIFDVLPAPDFIGTVYHYFYNLKDQGEYLFADLRSQLFDNLIKASGYDPQTYDGKRTLTLPEQMKEPSHVIYAKYLSGTPIAHLLAAQIPFVITPEIQHAHTWVVAGSGHGKTTALASMIYEHIPEVLRGESSIVLIDSQNVIIPALERLKVWDGSDRLIIVDPAEPVAFSLFDVPNKSGAMLNNALEMIDFVFAKLTDTETTHRQANLFAYISEFLITAVEGATIHDFRNMMDTSRAPNYAQYHEKASSEIQDYLATDFIKEKFTLDARHQVVTKMRGMLRNTAFAQMFGSPKTKLNLFKELERGTCILIKPDKDQLGEDGTRLFGRFWIAQMKLVAQQRATTQKKTPTYFYIDECQDYLRGGDPKIEGILEQARKQNIGLTLLHHYADQLKSTDLVQLLGANTATKICGSLASSDLSRFASYLQCDPRFIQQQEPRKTFAVHVRGLTKSAVSLAFPFIDLAKELRMSESAWRAMRQRNRERYGAQEPPRREAHDATSGVARAVSDAPKSIPPKTHDKVKPAPNRKEEKLDTPVVNKPKPQEYDTDH